MKIRNGFVSNSSSSSFLIVGVDRHGDPRLNKLAKADKADLNESWGGTTEGKTLVFLGGDFEYGDNDEVNINSFNPTYVGINAEQALKAGKTVQELKKEFIAKAQALGVTFTEKEVDLHYGEVNSEG